MAFLRAEKWQALIMYSENSGILYQGNLLRLYLPV